MNTIKALADILKKAQGRICAESRKDIDIGAEVVAIRNEYYQMQQRIAELEAQLRAMVDAMVAINAIEKHETVNHFGPEIIRERIEELIEQYGSLRAAAEAIGFNYSYLSRLRHGRKTSPSRFLLNILGLERAPVYRNWPQPKMTDAQ